MGSKAPKLCKHPRCGALVFDGAYCSAHKVDQRADRLQGQKEYNARRAETDRLYSSQRWRKLSVVFRKRHPLCCECEAQGLVRVADLVDHIQPAKARPDLFFEWSNLRSLCQRHHNEIGEKVRAGSA